MGRQFNHGLYTQQYADAFDILEKGIGGISFIKDGAPIRHSAKLRAVIDTDGSQEDTNGWEKDVFTDLAASTVPALRSQRPSYNTQGELGSSFYALLWGFSVRMSQNVVPGTDTLTILNELMQKLGECMLEMKVDDQIIFHEELGQFLVGYPGLEVSQDGNANYASAATPPLVARGRVFSSEIGMHFPDLIHQPPGVKMELKVYGEGAWVQTADRTLNMTPHMFYGAKG